MGGTRSKHKVMAGLTMALVLLIGYALAEITTRLVLFPKSGTGMALTEIEQKLGDGATLEQLGGKEDWNPKTGWGLKNESTYRKEASPAAKSIILIGDSVTAGHAVAHDESFAARYQVLLGDDYEIKNWGVNGFGVDQMLLKLEARKSEIMASSAVIFAYIPHDLRRPAHSFLFGVTKPRFDTETDRFEDAQSMQVFIDNFRSHQRTLRLFPWLAGRMIGDRAYFFPGIYKRHFAELFEAVSARLGALSEPGHPVYVVRLTNFYAFDADIILEGLWNEKVAAAARNNPNLRVVDIEDCVLKRAAEQSIDPKVEFAFHPNPAGHSIYARCIADAIKLQ